MQDNTSENPMSEVDPDQCDAIEGGYQIPCLEPYGPGPTFPLPWPTEPGCF